MIKMVAFFEFTKQKIVIFWQKRKMLFLALGLFLVAIVALLLVQFYTALSATYTWVQTDWSGGATANYPTHPTGQTGWTEYSEKDTSTDTSTGSITALLQNGSSTQTTTADFTAGTTASTTIISSVNGEVILSLVVGANTWVAKPNSPGWGWNGNDLIAAGDYIYSPQGHNYTPMWAYSISNNNWNTTFNPTDLPAAIAAGGSGVYPGSGDYIFWRNATSPSAADHFWAYSISQDSWNSVFNPSEPTDRDGSYSSQLISDGTYIFSNNGRDSTGFKRYSISGNSWTVAASLPAAAATTFLTSLAYPGSGNYIYKLRDAGSTEFWAYKISTDNWNSAFDPTNAPVTALDGGALYGYGDYIYFLRGGGTSEFYAYSITNNNWTTFNPTDPPTTFNTSNLTRMERSGGCLYTSKGSSSSFYCYVLPGYYTSGVFTSSAIDTGHQSTFTTFSFNSNKPTNTNVQFQLRSADTQDGLTSATWYGPTGTEDFYTATSATVINPIHNNNRWVQYKTILTTTDPNYTPTLSDVTINYQYYPTVTTLTSSAFNTSDSANTLAGIRWSGDAPSGSTITFQLRTAVDNTGVPGTWTEWYGPSGTSSYFTDPAGEGLPSILSDGVDDQWIQYKVYMGSNGTAGASLNDVTLTYVVNAPPIVWNVINDPSGSLDQNSDGGISLLYDITDIDSANGEATFFYDLGVVLADEGGTLAINDTTDVVVNDSTFLPQSGTIMIDREIITYTANSTSTATLTGITRGEWPGNPSYRSTTVGHANGTGVLLFAETTTGSDAKSIGATTTFSGTLTPKTDVPNFYSPSARVAVVMNDSDMANMIGIGTSSTFSLDTKNPASEFITFDSATEQLTISVFDNSPTQMKLSNNSNLSPDGVNSDSGTWIPYGTDGDADSFGDLPLLASVTKAWVGNTMDPETVYVQFKDNRNNLSPIISATTPRKPDNLIYRDVSNVDTSDFKMFIAWGVVPLPTPGFKNYKVFRSQDGGAFELVKTITSRSENYTIDSGLLTESEYAYKVYAEDNDGSISNFSNIVTDIPNGQGGSDLTSPSISNVVATNLMPQGVQITFDTDEVSNATVGYSVDTGYGIETGNGAMTEQHSVIIARLTPDTTYNFRVKSEDPIGNVSDWVEGFQFTTPPGPAISHVTMTSITNVTATVNWLTDIPADSYVVYSLNADMTESSEVGAGALVTNHSITLTNLVEGETYYYYVKSTDVILNLSTDTNTGEYYSFLTTIDSNGPVITNVTIAMVNNAQATITWTTDENSTSQLIYGTNTSYGQQSVLDTTLSIQHSVTIDELDKETAYRFKVSSSDVSGNNTQDDDGGVGYSFTTTDDPGVVRTVSNDADPVDTSAPVVTGSTLTADVASTSALITWVTGEAGSSLVDYGFTADYTFLAGNHEERVTNHRVSLIDLFPGTRYHFRTVSYDSAGNAGMSQDTTFTTLSEDGIVVEEQEITPDGTVLPPVISGIEEGLTDDEESILDTISRASESFITAILSVLPNNPNLNKIPEDAFIQTINDMAPKVVSSPEITSQNLTVDVGATWAKFTWVTNKKANGMVALALNENYVANGFTRKEGDPEELSEAHEVMIEGLLPSSTYRYQLLSKALLGDWAKSPEATFMTTSLTSQITDLSFKEIGTMQATLLFTTTLPTKTSVEVTDTLTGKKLVFEDPSYLKDHEMTLDKLDLSTSYVLQVVSHDEDGNVSSSSVLPFTTQASLVPPVISQIRTTTALVPGQSTKVQTIVSWKTDKPATGRVLFEEGVSASSELAQATPLLLNLINDHIVVTTAFKPGTVYRFRIESIDGAGHVSLSKDYTLLTPREEENIVDLILNNFEQSFGFLKKISF